MNRALFAIWFLVGVASLWCRSKADHQRISGSPPNVLTTTFARRSWKRQDFTPAGWKYLQWGRALQLLAIVGVFLLWLTYDNPA